MDTEGQIRSGVAEVYKPIRLGRRYRINTKKFARSLTLLGCLVAVIVAVCFSANAVPAVIQAAAEPKATAGTQEEASMPAGGALAGKTVVVDAGHGGFDIGATGASGSHESDLNLKVAAYLKADLEQAGALVVMTREDKDAIADTKDGDMDKRRQIIQESGSDIVVSVHMNANTNTDIRGPLVLFAPGANESEKLAKMIQNDMQEKLAPPVKNTARAENLFILQSCTQPGVLVECGFITNPEEEALILQNDYQQKIAQAIAQGCGEFLQP